MLGKNRQYPGIRWAAAAALLLLTAGLPASAQAADTVYDFTTGAGTTRIGYELSVSAKPPTANNVPSSTTITYSNIDTNDGTYDQAFIKANDLFAAQRFRFTIAENELSITQITPFWNGVGYRKLGTEGAELYIWNFNSGSYTSVASSTSSGEINLTGDITSNIGDYIDGSGYLYLIVVQNQVAAHNREAYVDTDYVSVTISANTAPSISINSAAQKTDGTGVVDVSVDASDPENNNSRIALYYGTSSGAANTKATLTGSATATVTPVPDVTNANVYQVGDDTPVLTSSTNTVTFDWASATDLAGQSGTYWIRTVINDGSTDNSGTVETSLTIDNVVPTNPTAPASAWDSVAKASTITNNTWQSADDTPYFEWTGASDTGSSVTGYSVYFGTSPTGEPGLTQEQAGANYTVGTGTGDGTNYLRVRTFDTYGNYSAPITLFTFKYDNTAPTNPTATTGYQSSAKITTITDDTWQNADNTPYFEWTGAGDGSGSGVAGYSVYFGTSASGEPGLTQEQSGNTHDVTSGVASGTYYLRVRTFDNAGASSAPATLFTFKYDNTAPTNPTAPASAWNDSGKSVVISDNTPQDDDQTPYFEWSGAADSDSGVSGYSVYFGTSSSGEPGTSEEQSTANFTVGTATGETANYLRVRAFDTLGNMSAPVTLFTFIYDVTKPTATSVTVTPNPTGAIAIGALQFKLVFSETMDTGTAPTITYDPAGATGNQNVSTSGAWSTTTNTNDTYTVYNDSAVTSSTGDGTATISITLAQDVAGNVMNADTNDTFTIDSAIAKFVITHDGSGLINTAENITITAKTTGGNTVTDYTGTITMSTVGETGEITWALQTGSGIFNDNGAADDTATYTFVGGDNGVVVLTMTSSAADTLDIEATDGTYNDDDTEGNMVVGTFALDHFVVSHDNAGVAGVAESITVTAINTESNTKTDYVGTITLDTNGTATTIAWGLTTGQGTFNDGGGSVDTATYTFNINDNGVAVFTFTDNTAETVDIDVSDASIVDDDTEGNMVIGPAGLDHFLVAHDNAAIAGTADNVTVTARDAFNNTKTDYTGTITLDTSGTATAITWAKITGGGTFNDGGAGVDTATYTYVGADNGVAVFSITDTKTESIDIDVSGGGKTDNDSEGNMVVSPDVLNYFVVAHDNAANAGVSENVTVTAYDQHGNVKTDYTGTATLDTNGTATTITWALVTGDGTFNDGGASVDTATYTFAGSDNGVAVFSINDTTQETIDVDVSDAAITDNDSEGNLVVGAPVLNSFTISHDNAANAGVAEQITITAKDSVGSVKTDYTGTITVDTNGTATTIGWTLQTGSGTFNDGGGAADTAQYTYVGSDNGVVVLNINDTTQETINISVSGDGKSDDDTEGNLVVGAPLLSHFVIGHDNTATAGTPESVTFTAKDTVGATKTDYTGTITVDTTGTATTITWANSGGGGTFNEGGASVDTATYTYAAGDNGVVTLTINDTLKETINISAADGGTTDDDTEGNLVIGPGALDHFRLIHDGSGTVNIVETITVQARDANENIKDDYTGTVTMDTNGTATTITWTLQSGNGTFNDGGASVDTATYTYVGSDNGVVVLRITDGTAETINISAADGGTTDDDLEGNLVINAAGLLSTGLTSPTTNSGGFGTPNNAHADDSSNATSASGTQHVYNGYGFSLPSNSIIAGIQLRADAFRASGGNPQTQTYSFELSHDGGTNYTSTGNVTPVLQTTQQTYNFGSSSDLWGRSAWTETELNDTNFRVRVTASGAGSKDRNLDWVPINIFYTTGLSAVSNNVTTTNVDVGSSDNLIMDFTVTNSHTAAETVTSITVNNTGTAPDSAISSVKLYYDSNNSGDYTSGVDSQIGSGTFASGTKTFSGLSVNVASGGGTEEFFVVLDVASGATAGNTLDVEVPANGITGTLTGTIEPTAINSTGTRTLAVTLNHFVISHDTAGVAGLAENITITAKSSGGSTITDYTGTITVDTNGTATTITWAKITGNGTFNDGGAGVDTATYTFVGSDNGVVVLSVNDTLAETINISVSGDGKTDDNTEGNLVIAPGPLDHFVVVHDGNAVAGTADNVTVTAKDNLENTITTYTGQITLDTNGTATTITWALSSGFGTFNDGGASVDTATYTYSGSDNGAATFTITDNTAETINITVTGGGKSDDNTEGNLVVAPAALDHFVVAHDNSAIAGVAENVTITAVDTLGNTKTNYTGQITVDTNGTATTITWANSGGNGAFLDGGASVDTATYTYAGADNGVVTLTINDTKTETINISVSGDSKTDENTEGDLVVNPGAIDHFITVHDGTAVTGVAENVTITAYDANNNIKTDYTGTVTLDTNGTATSISWTLSSGSGTLNDGGASVDTATYTYVGADNGAATFGITNITAESVDVDVTGDTKTDDDSEGLLQFVSSGIDHFVITHDGNAISSVAENITIRAENANNDTITTYQGTITLDTNGTETAITWALVTGNGTFNDDGASADTATYTFTASDNGVVTLSLTDTVEETINVAVTGEGQSDDNTEGNLVINPAGLHHFLIAHDNNAVAGIVDNITITAKDANNGTVTGHTGLITVDTNGTATAITWSKITGGGAFVEGGASVDTATYTYVAGDNGVAVLGINDTKVETINISVSGDGKSDDDTEGTIAVAPGPIDHFVITQDGSAVAGVADNITVRAEDAYANIKTDYTGQITLDTNGTATTITWLKVTGNGAFLDGGASVDTATYTYDATDNGQAVFSINDTTAETLNISVSGDSKTDDDTEGNLVVSPAALDRFLVAHDTAAEAGIADNVTITAYDTLNNIKTDYTGQITVDTSGTATTITWAKVTGGGAFVDGGASVDTATYTYVSGDSGVAVLSIVDTKAESIDIDVSGDSKTDDDTEGNLVVGPTVLNNFVVAHDGNAAAGIAENVTITAYDTYANTKTNYTGTITVDTNGTATTITWAKVTGGGAFVDGGASVDTATYTYVGGDSGVAVLSISDTSVETIDIDVSGDGKFDDDTEANLVVGPGAIDSFVITHDTSAIQSVAEQVTITAKDAFANTKTNYTGTISLSTLGETGEITWALQTGSGTFNDDGGGVDTASYAYVSGDNGVVVLTITAGAADTLDLEVSGDSKVDDDTEGNLVVTASSVTANAVANSVVTTSVGAGATDVLIMDLTVTNNNVLAGDTITAVTVTNAGTASDAEISSVKLYYDSNNSGDYTSGVDAQAGSGTFSSGSKAFTGLSIPLAAAGTEELFVVLDVSSTINDGDTLDVSIPISGITLTSAPAIETSVLNSSGTRAISLVLDHFLIAHDTAAVAGTPEQVTITAKDSSNNTVTTYTGSISMDTTGTATAITWALQTGGGAFNDGGASVDTASYTYAGADNGVAVFTINDTKAESINISVSGDGKTDDDTEGNLVVAAGSIDHLVITHDSSAVAGVADNVTVTAKDANENTVSNFTGEITLDTNGTANAITWALQTGFGTFNDGGASVDTATYTYSSSDNSVATFTISDTVAESLNISATVTGTAETDDDTEGNLVVAPAGIDHFLIAHDNAAQAGVADNVTITAKDQYNNTITNYTSQITVDTDGTASTITWAKVTGGGVFVDGGGAADTATYTYVSGDNGVAVLSVNDTTVENLNISVSGDTKTDDDTEGTLNVGPGLLDHFEITHDGFAAQNAAENIIIQAYDAYNHVKTDYTGTITVDTDGTATAITWALVTGGGTFNDGGASVDTATYTYIGGDSGQVTLSITDTAAEVINISVSGDSKTDDDNEGVLDIVAAGFHHFKISHDGNGVVNVAEQITITAKDVSDVTVTNYVGTMTVDTNGTASAIAWALQTGNGVFNDNGAGVDTATYTFDATDNGVVVLTLTDTAQETINISASGSGQTDDNTEGNLVINAAGIDNFLIAHDNAAVAGVADSVTITARDANNNTVTDYTGTITIDTTGTAGTIAWGLTTGNGTFNDGGASVDTATYTYNATDNGVVVVTITNNTAETLNISVVGDSKTDENTEGDLVVSPAAIDHFVIAHDGNAEAGVAENVTITAKDAFENTLTNYTSQITVDTDGTATTITWANSTGGGAFVDGGASVDTATYTYVSGDNGVVTLTIDDTTVETINISVSGDSKTDDNTEGNLIVGAGAINKFVVSHDGTATAGVAESVTVTAYDTFNNIKTNYTGQITLDTNGTATAITWALSSGGGSFLDGGGSVDTATYTYIGADNGVATFTINDTAVETIDVDVSGSGKFDDDTEGNLVVSAAGLDHFLVTHDNVAVAGTPENVTIAAKDAFNNTLTGYTGTITVDTNGTATTITWANSGGGGTFNDGGASVDTATYTYVGGDSGSVTLTVNDTTAETINISVSGDTKFDDDTEGNLVVGPGALSYFLIAHDGTGIQSVAEPITVTAKDANTNTKTDYTGTITLDTNGDVNNISWAINTGSGTFNDGGAGVDTATYTYVGGDSGVAIFDITDNTAETIDIAVSDGGTTDDNTEGNLVIQASSTTVDAVANSVTSGFQAAGATNLLVMDISLTNNDVIQADDLTAITINNSGTISDAQISAVKLYYDSNNSGSFNSGVDTQLDTGTFSGGSVTFSALSVDLVAAGGEDLFVVVDLAGTVTDGASVDVSVPIDGMTFTNAPTTPGSVLNSSGSFTVDSLDPAAVGSLATTSHTNATGAWNSSESNDNTVVVSWSPATDSGSGVDGYSYIWDTNPTTLPDTTKDIEEGITTRTSPALTDGIAHYFHIRSVDNVGNWDATAEHVGPFYVDTTAPTSTSIYQITEYAGSDYLYVSGSTVYYSGLSYAAFKVFVEAADALAGLSQAQYPATISSGGTDATEAGGAYEYEFTYQTSTAGSSYNNVNVVVSDLAGNTANVPFSVVLDNTGPNAVSSLTASSHTPSVSSSDNDIIFTWSDVADSQTAVEGYSILVDANATSIPPKVITVNQGVQTYTEQDLANGTYYAHIRAVDSVGNWSSSVTHAGPYIIGRGSLSAAITTSANVVSTDQNLTVTMTVTNNGSATVNTVDPSTLTVNSVGSATATTSSDPAAQNITSSQQRNYVWTYTAGSSPGIINFEGFAQGTDTEGAIASATVKSPDVFVENKAALTTSITVSPTTANANQTINITVTVNNTGEADALGVVPSVTPSGTASPVIDTGPSPASSTIRGGQSKQFTFTAHAVSAGTATFTSDVSSGTDENSGVTPSAATDQANVTINAPPSLGITSTITATPTALQPAGTITVTMTVQNTGNTALTNVTPSALTIGGTSSDAALASGPTPANVSSLAAAASQVFTWTYTAGTTLGTVNFTGNATAAEISSSSSSSGNVTIQAASAALSSAIVTTPTAVLTNANVTVTMTVTNTAVAGGASATGVSPSILTLGGTSGEANLVSGPTPASATIAPQANQAFVWTYKAGTTAGTLNFTGNATGTDGNSGSDVSSTANASSNVTISTLAASWQYPAAGSVPIGPIRSVPVAYTGIDTSRVYLGSDDNNLYIIDATTHNLINTFTSSGDIRGLPYPSTEDRSGTLTDIVYFGTIGKTVYGLWADNVLRWERVLGEELSTTVLYDFVSNIYFGSKSNNVYCISNTTGNDVWVDTTTVGGSIEESAAIVYVPSLDYDEVYFGAGDGKVYSFKTTDGTGSRTFDTGDGTPGAVKTSINIAFQDPSQIATTRRLLLFGTDNGKFYAVNTADMSSSTASTGWTTNPIVTGGAVNSSPWVDTATRAAYFGSRDGKLYGVKLLDGTALPNFPVDLGSPIDGWPIVLGNYIYVGADNGKFYAIDKNTGLVVPGWPYNTGGPIKSGASLQVIFDESFNIIDILIMVGSDSGRMFAFDAVE